MADEGLVGFVGRCPFKHDGKSCFAQRRVSPRRFAAGKGASRRGRKGARAGVVGGRGRGDE